MSDTFIDSLAKLTGDEQKSVKTTAFGGARFFRTALCRDYRTPPPKYRCTPSRIGTLVATLALSAHRFRLEQARTGLTIRVGPQQAGA